MDSSLMFRQTGGSRKRPFSLAGFSDFSNENSEEFNIHSLEMKESNVFQSPESTSMLKKQESETTGMFKVPISGSVGGGGQSPYFNVTSTPIKKSARQDAHVVKPINTDFSHETRATPSNAIIQKEQPPKLQPEAAASIAFNNKEDNDNESKPRALRQIGEFTVSSLEKEFQEVLEFLKQERDRDQQLFLQSSKSLRDRTESVIEHLEHIIKGRYRFLDENLRSAIDEFEKELDSGRKLEEEVTSLRNHMSSIMNNILQDPSLE